MQEKRARWQLEDELAQARKALGAGLAELREARATNHLLLQDLTQERALNASAAAVLARKDRELGLLRVRAAGSWGLKSAFIHGRGGRSWRRSSSGPTTCRARLSSRKRGRL